MMKHFYLIAMSMLFVPFYLAHASANKAKPIWAKHAEALDLSCSTTPDFINSPDDLSRVDILCKIKKDEDPVYLLQVRTRGERLYQSPLEMGANELLWSPDSKAFFINGSTSSYAGFFMTLYRLTPDLGWHGFRIDRLAQRDMVRKFPPCKAYNRDEEDCRAIVKNPGFNMSGLAWGADSSTIDVFAEVPCSSFYGGIMCAVQGYRLQAVDGQILGRLTAKQISRQWQKNMGWHMNIPDPPAYGPGNVTFRSLPSNRK